jgi:uncharacterized BrkB/YihY/UPF0761 family membrane protein
MANALPDELPTEDPTRWQQLYDRMVDEFTDAAARIPVLGAIVLAARSEHDAGGGLLAGGVAYRLFFWMLPVGLAVASAASMLGVEPSGDLEDAARSRGLGALMVGAMRQAIDASAQFGWYQLVVSIVLSIWFGHGVVRALNVQFALAWQQPIRRVRRPVLAGIAFTAFTTTLMFVASHLGRIVDALGLGVLANLSARVLIFAAVAFLVAIAFPHGDAPRRALWPGCIVGALGAVGLFVAVNLYLAPKVDQSLDTYGILGVATVILLWLYLFARLIGVSAFLNAALWRQLHERAGQDPDAARGSTA